MRKGQITVFIIIGLIILLVVGTVLYITRTRVTREFEAKRPQVAEVPQQIQPLRDLVEQCILRLGKDGLRRIGDSGGYIDSSTIPYNPGAPTDGDSVQFSPGAGPNIAYWWYMKSKNSCTQGCVFDSKRPGLFRREGGMNIEYQLDKYVTSNLRDCLSNFEGYQKQGCKVQELGEPTVTANVAESDVFFVGKYPLRAVCGEQTFDMEDYYVTIDLNLREIYELATELTNFESQERFLEQTTKNLIESYGDLKSSAIPPPRGFEAGPPHPGLFWVKFEVEKKLKALLAAHIPLIQASGARNYKYIRATEEARDTELNEVIYNRQFLLPLNESHPSLDAHFMYLDWWRPYFDLNCNGQLCQADSATNFAFIPFTLNRYEFAYDVSYPVLVEIRNPETFNREGYSFKFFLEENMRNSDGFYGEAPAFQPIEAEEAPSIFCNPDQQTSGTVTLKVRDGATLRGAEAATVSYLCGDNNCNLGYVSNGTFVSKFPRCLGGTLRITKQDYASYSTPLDTFGETPLEPDEIMLEPRRTLNASIKNFIITKEGKHGQWEFTVPGLLRPPKYQSATIQMVRNGDEYEEPFVAIAEVKGDKSSDIILVPGNYSVTISSFLKSNITIPPDTRCITIKKLLSKKKKCYQVPQEPILFNETSPLPYGGAEFNYILTSDMLRGAKKIEFRQFVIGFDKVEEKERIVEDLNELNKPVLYAVANQDTIVPVIT